MRTRLLWKISLLAVSLLTFGCQYRADVSVTGSVNNLKIDVKDESVPNSARGIAYVMLSANIGGKRKMLWQIDAKGGCAGQVSHLVYGEASPYFVIHKPPSDLEDRVDYEVDVGGCSYNGKVFFRLAKGQVVAIDRLAFDR